MNNKEMNNKEIIDRVMINKDMYSQDMNIEENNNEENNIEEFGVDEILDIYIPESSDNIESPDNYENESKLNNVVFYKEDSDEVIIIRNDLKNKWNNNNSNLPF